MKVEKNCAACGKQFVTMQSRIDKGNGKYCSRKCNSQGQQRRVKITCVTCSKQFDACVGSVKKGYSKFCDAQCYFKSEEVKIGGKSSKGSKRIYNEGVKNKNWKGDSVGYTSLHMWVYRKLGKANHCVECDADEIPKGYKRFFQWSNISQYYRRDLSDWRQLCVICHTAIDKMARAS